MPPTKPGIPIDRLDRARALVRDLMLHIGAGRTVDELAADVGPEALVMAALERLEDPALEGYALPFTQTVFRRFGTVLVRERIAAVLCDPARPRPVRARMADLLIRDDQERFWALVDGPLADDEAAAELALEGLFEREVSLLVAGMRTPTDVADRLETLPQGWREAAGAAYETVRARLGIPASACYGEAIRRPGLVDAHEAMIDALSEEGSDAAADVLRAALEAGVSDADGALRAAYEAIRIRRHEEGPLPVPSEGEFFIGSLGVNGRAMALVAVGAGGLARRIYAVELCFDGSGAAPGFIAEAPRDATPMFAGELLRDGISAPFREGIEAIALAAADGIEADELSDRAAIQALLSRRPRLESPPVGRPFSARELKESATAGSLEGWTFTSDELRIVHDFTQRFFEPDAADDEADDVEPDPFDVVMNRFARRLRLAGWIAGWRGQPELAARFFATAESEPEELFALVLLIGSRQLGVLPPNPRADPDDE